MSFGIYIHLPYCITKCPYCDFNSYGTGGEFPEEKYTDAILAEIETYKPILNNRVVETVFFGGGTPSLFSSDSLKKIINRISVHSDIKDKAEVSLELNPKTVDEHKLNEFREIGINRLSVGVQSFTERKLDFYGRINKPKDSENVLNWIKNAGFDSFNIDLIYGSMDETLKELNYDLEKALSFNPPHISAYCLTIEDGTEFGRLYKSGKLKIPDDKRLGGFMNLTSMILENNGYTNYEISNFSKPGFECRHNLLYWRSNDYLGLGAGAHSHIRQEGEYLWGARWFNYRSPDKYISCNENSETSLCKKHVLTRQEFLEDNILMGLRLREGISTVRLEEKLGMKFDNEKIGYLVDDKFLNYDGDHLSLTPKGRLFANEIIVRVCSLFS